MRGRATFGRHASAPRAVLRGRLFAGSDTQELLLEEPLRTDAEGHFTWNLPEPEGTRLVRVESPSDDLEQSPAHVVVPAGSAPPEHLEVVLYPMDATLEGTVRDVHGNPLAGAEVFHSRWTTTDELGAFSSSSAAIGAERAPIIAGACYARSPRARSPSAAAFLRPSSSEPRSRTSISVGPRTASAGGGKGSRGSLERPEESNALAGSASNGTPQCARIVSIAR